MLAVTPLEDRTTPAAVGSPDPAFGTAGVFAWGIADSVVAVHPTPDGKLLVTGNAGNRLFVSRLLATGELDTSFGTGGSVVATDPSGKTLAAAAALRLASGVLLVFGSGAGASDTDSAVVQVNPSGEVFGPLYFDIAEKAGAAGKADAFTGAALNAANEALIVGTATNAAGDTDFVVSRYGVGFSPLGTAVVDVGGAGRPDEGVGVAVAPDGRVFLSGTSGLTNPDVAVARLDADLTNPVSKAFDLGGAGGDFGGQVAVANDGRVFVAGTSEAAATGRDFAVLRLDADLNLQQTAAVDFGGAETSSQLALDAFGRVVVFGTSLPPSGTGRAFAVARLLPDALGFDPVFDGDGRQLVFANVADSVTPRATLGAVGTIDNAGRVVVAGRTVTTAAVAARLAGTAGVPGTVLATGPQAGRVQVVARGATPADPPLRLAGEAFDGYPGAAFDVRAAVGDVTGDGFLDTIFGTGVGPAATVTVLNGATNQVLATITPFEGGFTAGVFVAAADLTGDGRAEVIVSPDRGGGPVVAIFDGGKLATTGKGEGTELTRFLGIDDAAFRGGARPAVGDVTGDGVPDLVVAAGFSGGPRVTVWDGRSVRALAPRQLANFFAFEDTVRNGAFVSVGDVTGDGVADVAFGGGPGGAPRVRVFDGAGLVAAAGTFRNVDEIPAAQVSNFFAGDAGLRGGVRLSVRDLDGDTRADLVTGSGEGEPARLRVYAGARLAGSPTPDQELTVFGGVALAGGVFVG